MAHFTDYDDFLRAQEQADEDSYTARQKRMQAARQSYDSVISETFSLIKEYHEKIILPRKKLILVLKKHEESGSKESSPYSFLYRANLIPIDFLPPAFTKTDIMERVDYLTPGKVTPHDWHANVALQVTTVLEETSELDDVLFRIHMKSWGHTQTNDKMILSKNTTLKHEIDRRTPFTVIDVNSQGLSEKQLLQEIENLFLIITPHVLSHREIVWKK